jgi:hypothetical protein
MFARQAIYLFGHRRVFGVPHSTPNFHMLFNYINIGIINRTRNQVVFYRDEGRVPILDCLKELKQDDRKACAKCVVRIRPACRGGSRTTATGGGLSPRRHTRTSSQEWSC